MSDGNTETTEWYAANHGESATNHLAVDALAQDPDSSILDAGCGTGAALRHAATRAVTGALTGVAVVPRLVEFARERAAAHPAAERLRFVGKDGAVGTLRDVRSEAGAAGLAVEREERIQAEGVHSARCVCRRAALPGAVPSR